MTRFGLGATVMVLMFSVAATADGQVSSETVLAPGSHELSIEHDGRVRRYLVHVPPHTGAPLPVVLSFHGGGGNAENHRDNVRWEKLADEERFIVVYPYGSGRLERRLLTWNAEDCCGYSLRRGVDDVGFVRALLVDLGKRVPIDRSRIYASGFSNGGMFTYRLAAEAADVIAAVAPVAGAVTIDSIRTERAVPLIHIHSVDDPRALYDGGLGPPFPFTNQRVMHAPVDSAIAQWVAHNGCPKEPVQTARIPGQEGSDSAGHAAERRVYAPCRDGAEVVLWRLEGPGHAWPGGDRRRPEWLVGEPTDVIQAKREIWQFLSRFSLEPPPAPPH